MLVLVVCHLNSQRHTSAQHTGGLDECELTLKRRCSAPRSGCLCTFLSPPWSHSKSTAGWGRWQTPVRPVEKKRRVRASKHTYFLHSVHVFSLFCRSHVYQAVDEEELEDVEEHPPQGDLQRSQVRVGREKRDESQGAENVGDGEHRLSDQRRVPHLPLVPGFAAAVLNRARHGVHFFKKMVSITVSTCVTLTESQQCTLM